MVVSRSILDSLALLWHSLSNKLYPFVIFFRLGLLLLRKCLVMAQDYTAIGWFAVSVFPGLRGCPGTGFWALKPRVPDQPGQLVTLLGSPNPQIFPYEPLFLLLESWVTSCLTLDSQSPSTFGVNLWAQLPHFCFPTPWFLIHTLCRSILFASFHHGQHPLSSLHFFPLWDLIMCSS